MLKPLLLIDVDGVLNPFAARPPGHLPPNFEAHQLEGYRVLLNRKHGAWLSTLGQRFELVWATTWEEKADRLIAPRVGLPSGLPVITFPQDRQYGGWTWKLPAVIRFVGDRPLAWVDDDLGSDALRWGRQREVPTLLVEPDPGIGLTRAHIQRLERFALQIESGLRA